MALRLLVALACLSFATAVRAQQPTPPDAIEKLVARLEQALANADRPALLALAVKDADATSLDDFAAATSAKPTRVVIKERDRMPLDGKRQQILIEVFVERGIEAQLSTWRVELRPPSSKADGADWHIERMEPISTVAGLYRLALNTAKQFDVRNLVVEGTDVSIDMSAGTAFVAEIPDGPTAIILLGRGRIRFAPPETSERTQIRIFTGADDLQSEFDAAFIRLRPSEFQARFRAESLVPRGVVATDLRRANEIFDEYVSKTLQIDLTDLSRDRWSLIPSAGDLIAEVRTRRFGSLTYARSGNEAEDVTVFDRKRRRNISIYASGAKLETRGRFYSEDDLVDYDIMSYDMDATFAPERYWINGTAHMRVRVRAGAMTTMTLKLAEALTVRGVYAPGFGRLLHLRVVNQNSLIVNLPAPVFQRQRVRADDHLQRAPRAERARSRSDCRTANRAAGTRAAHHSARAALHLQQQFVLVSAVDGERLRPRHRAHHRAQRVRRRRHGHLDRTSEAGHRDAGRDTPPEDVRLPERSAGSLPLVRHQPHDVGDVDASADQAIEWRLWRRARGHSGSRRAGSASVGASGVDKSSGWFLHPPTRPASL